MNCTRQQLGKKSRWRTALVLLCLFACPAAAQAAETVQSLRYGATLYHFFQQDYFDALTELMAAQQLHELGAHTDNAELLRAGMSLSYGMDRIAERVFRDLLAEPGTAVDRDQAWFYLAKLAWQRGEWQRGIEALEQMSAQYGGPLAGEADYLRASIALRRGDENGAAGHAARLPQDSLWLYYHYYNMGAALAARGEWLGAARYFHRFEQPHLSTGEGKALRDKALTAAGFALLAAGQYEQAATDFTRVRLNSPMTDRALLGYGWASTETGDFHAALSPWQALSERSVLNESVRESLLAIPYAYEQLGRQGTALSNYRMASAVYASELEQVQLAIEVFRRDDLLELLELDRDEAQDWLSGADMLPLGEQLPYLAHLLTRHSFQVAMRELRDLHRVASHLSDARGRLQVLVQVDTDQQQSWSTVIEGDRYELLQGRQQDLQETIDRLGRRLADAEAGGDARLLADAEQAARWTRLDRASDLAGQLDIKPEQARLLALYRGLMIWEDNENYPARAWQVKRQLQELQSLARQSRGARQHVEEAITRRGQSGFAPRIAALQERVRNGDQRVQLAIGESAGQLRQVAIVELQRQAGLLSHALGQSRLAVARLYDLGSPEVPR